MADTKQQPPEEAPKGPPPQSHEQINGPGMTNGVPDQVSDDDAKAYPDSDRKDTEAAGGKAGG